jgi:hypothetical protein
MKRFWIISLTAAAMIALAARWVPLEVGGAGDGCPSGGTCAAEYPAPKASGGPDWFYGGEGVNRTSGGVAPADTREGPRSDYEFRCDPGRDEGPSGAGEELPRSCEDVRARLY